MQAPNRCTRCKKQLQKQIVRVQNMRFHPQCFTCDQCHKPLGESFQVKEQKLYHPDCFKQTTGLTCAHCRKILEDKWLERNSRKYHPACYEKFYQLKCTHCGLPVTDKYSKDENGRYHPACYEQLHQLICSICNQSLQGKYLIDLWGNKAHPQHPTGPTQQCQVCARLISEKTSQGGVAYPGGRMVCGLCHSSVIHDPKPIQQAKLEVIQQLQGAGFDYIPDYIKICLYDDQQLINERLRASPTGNIHGYTKTVERHIPTYGLILEHSISIVAGLPRVAFMGVMAHELLHVWINERKLSHLSKPEVEGFCNLGTALIFHHEASPLAQVLLKRMAQDPDRIYGDGYREMSARLQQMGWPALIAAVQQRQ